MIAAAAAGAGAIAAVLLVRARHVRYEAGAEDEVSLAAADAGTSPAEPRPHRSLTSAERTLTIDRPPAAVFAFIERGENNPRWRTRVTDITRDSGGGGVGTTYRQGERGPLGRRIDADFRVTEYEVPHRYAYEVTTGPARPRAAFTLEPLDGGRTRLNFTLEWTPAGIAHLIVPFVAKGIRRELADLDGLKRALETDDGYGQYAIGAVT